MRQLKTNSNSTSSEKDAQSLTPSVQVEPPGAQFLETAQGSQHNAYRNEQPKASRHKPPMHLSESVVVLLGGPFTT
jgi:hypothetical protein